MQSKAADAVGKIYFTALAFLMYFFINEVAYIGGIGVTFRHIFALTIIASAFVYFLIRSDVGRALVSVKSALVFATPLLVVVVASMLVWVVDQSGTATIARGISGCLVYTNWLSCALAAGALLYVFGEAGIWYNLLALVGANLLMIIQIIREDGLAVFFQEFFELVASFAANTGEVIIKAEIHELAFCLGAYLIYMLIRPKRAAWFWVLFALAAFCFLVAFKRIAMIAMMGVAVIWLILWIAKKVSQRAVCRTANIIMLILVALFFLYIAAIKADLFTVLEKAGIDTSGRAFVYEQVDRYYEFSPDFLGNGIGFLTYQLNETVSVGVSAVHNDLLQFFIDLGFWGYLFWLLSMTVLRTAYFGRGGDGDSAMVAALLSLYLFIVSSTDNTINYPLLNTVLGVIIIGNHYTERVAQASVHFRRIQ